MKFIQLFIVISCITFVFTNETFLTSENKNKNNAQNNVSFNSFEKDGEVVAVAYGLGSNGGYTIANPKMFKTPQTVDKINQGESPYPPNEQKSEKMYAEETPSVTDYYDGEFYSKLNAFEIQCSIYRDIKDCTHKSHCGWCKVGPKCMEGNLLGPIKQLANGGCPTSQYIFTSPVYGSEKTTIHNIGGLSVETKNPEA